jgi:membrane protein
MRRAITVGKGMPRVAQLGGNAICTDERLMRRLTFQHAWSVLSVGQLWTLVRQAVAAWIDDYAPSMGAALAYYPLFSIAPVLLIVIAIAGSIYGEEATRGEIVAQLAGLIGREGAVAIQGLLESTSTPERSTAASLIGVGTLVIGATSVFGELQNSLDRIWRAPALAAPAGNAVWNLVRSRLLSFSLVVSVGFILLVSLAVSAAISAAGRWWGGFFPGWEAVLAIVNMVVSFAATTFLFALIYRVLPRARIAWLDVWVGATMTALLFTLGKFVIGLYLGKAGVASGFGAAGSIVVLLVWVYYSAQIFLLGAEFTWVYAHRHGSRVNEPETKPTEVPARSEPHPAPASA